MQHQLTPYTAPGCESRGLINVSVEERMPLGVSDVEHFSSLSYVASDTLVDGKTNLQAILKRKANIFAALKSGVQSKQKGNRRPKTQTWWDVQCWQRITKQTYALEANVSLFSLLGVLSRTKTHFGLGPPGNDNFLLLRPQSLKTDALRNFAAVLNSFFPSQKATSSHCAPLGLKKSEDSFIYRRSLRKKH